MKTVEALLTMPILATFVAGANIIADADATTAVSNSGVEGMAGAAPVLALGAIAVLLASALYFIAREMRLEAIDQRERRHL